MKPDLEIYRHVDSTLVSDSLLNKLQTNTDKALSSILKLPKGPQHILATLQTIEISIVDNPSIASIHMKYLDDPSETDVITFPYNDGTSEIIVSVDEAIKQAGEYNEPWERELFRYIIHGLLHLHGYLDLQPEQRNLMFHYQEPLVNKHWES